MSTRDSLVFIAYNRAGAQSLLSSIMNEVSVLETDANTELVAISNGTTIAITYPHGTSNNNDEITPAIRDGMRYILSGNLESILGSISFLSVMGVEIREYAVNNGINILLTYPNGVVTSITKTENVGGSRSNTPNTMFGIKHLGIWRSA